MEIAIAIDSYDDLFSDFDIRSYGERAISRDLLDELRLRLRKAGPGSASDLVFLVPREARKEGDEELIVERLRRFFEERRAHYLREDRRNARLAALFVAIGLALSPAASLAAARLGARPLLTDFLLIPAWFFVWNGLELFLKGRGEYRRKRAYYESLAASRTSFRDIEGYAPR
ncbi:MAG TPA: hypothetical protein P5133_12360 [Spirochaetia bacterium]|nr:hypothetical protein [Spirochaetia bacterium]HRZ65716.1 hypothetical protein [Spirochaetia bacterium]